MEYFLRLISLNKDTCINFRFHFANDDRKRQKINVIHKQFVLPWPTKSELRCAYYGRNKAQIFNGAIDSANLKKSTLNQLHLLAKWKRKM
jgi:hypothetical protein